MEVFSSNVRMTFLSSETLGVLCFIKAKKVVGHCISVSILGCCQVTIVFQFVNMNVSTVVDENNTNG